MTFVIEVRIGIQTRGRYQEICKEERLRISRSNDNERLSRTLRVPLLFREPKRLRPAFCQKQDTSFGALKSCHSLMPPLLLESVLFIRLRLDNRNHSQNQSNIRGFPLSTYAERGRGCPGCRPKCVRNKGGCVNLVLCISPKCVQFWGDSSMRLFRFLVCKHDSAYAAKIF